MIGEQGSGIKDRGWREKDKGLRIKGKDARKEERVKRRGLKAEIGDQGAAVREEGRRQRTKDGRLEDKTFLSLIFRRRIIIYRLMTIKKVSEAEHGSF